MRQGRCLPRDIVQVTANVHLTKAFYRRLVGPRVLERAQWQRTGARAPQ
jgi:hypothetical protein